MYLRTLQKVQGNTYWEVNYASISKFFVFAPKISICFNSPFHEPLKGTCQFKLPDKVFSLVSQGNVYKFFKKFSTLKEKMW